MLPRVNRLTKKKDFAEVSKKGKGVGGEFLVLKFLKKEGHETRIGFVVSTKISKKAVVRNKIKRRLREILRANLPRLKPGYDLVFFTKKGIEKKDFWQIKQAAERLLKNLKT